jgi:hypothetical protein
VREIFFNVIIECQECGFDLSTSVSMHVNDKGGETTKIEVKPCDHCINQAVESANEVQS